MSKIIGRFKTINNDDIEVAIYNKTITLPNINIDSTKTVYFGDNPVIITQQNDDTFDHILKTQCKITLVTNRYLGEYLFANNWLDIIVNVWRNNECIFCGAVTPMTFQQNYSKIYEELEINAVDILSTLKERRLTDNATYSDLVAQSTIRPFNWFMTQMKLGDTANVIPNLPDIDFQEAEMHVWIETGWERIVQQSGEIVYYGIESNCIVLDEQTAIDTGETRRGEEKEVTWIQSEDTAIVDGVPYYVEYAWITVNDEQVNTGDWRVSSDEGNLPIAINEIEELDGWTRGPLPQPFEYYEHFTTSYVYDTGMTTPISDRIGDQIPEYPSTTSYNSYWSYIQGPKTDPDIDENTGYSYFKNYGWVTVNGVAQNSGDWVRGDMIPWVTGYTSAITGWQYDEPATPFEYFETVSYYTTYSDNSQQFAYNSIGTQIPLTPSTTSAGSYYALVQGAPNDWVIVNDEYHYKNYGWVSYAGNALEKTEDYVVGDEIPVFVIDTREDVTYWQYGNPETPFEYFETVSYYDIWSDHTETVNHTSQGEQIPLTPSTTTSGNYYYFQNGDMDDYTTYNNERYFKNYAWISLNSYSYMTSDWVRGPLLSNAKIYGQWTPYKSGGTPELSLTKNDGTSEHIISIYDPNNYSFEYLPDNITSIAISNPYNVVTITFDNVNTSYLTEMSTTLFANMEMATYIAISNINTSNVTNMSSMFYNCSSLTSLDLSSFTTNNVTNMSSMFNGCTYLQSLDLSYFNTSNVETMGWMFNNCEHLEHVDVSTFDMSKVKSTQRMFYNCKSITSIELNDIKKVNSVREMFRQCVALSEIDLSGIDFSYIMLSDTYNVNSMFYGCNSLSYLTLNDVSDATFNKITNTTYTKLPTSCTVYRDNNTYLYNSSTNKWEKQ